MATKNKKPTQFAVKPGNGNKPTVKADLEAAKAENEKLKQAEVDKALALLRKQQARKEARKKKTPPTAWQRAQKKVGSMNDRLSKSLDRWSNWKPIAESDTEENRRKLAMMMSALREARQALGKAAIAAYQLPATLKVRKPGEGAAVVGAKPALENGTKVLIAPSYCSMMKIDPATLFTVEGREGNEYLVVSGTGADRREAFLARNRIRTEDESEAQAAEAEAEAEEAEEAEDEEEEEEEEAANG